VGDAVLQYIAFMETGEIEDLDRLKRKPVPAGRVPAAHTPADAESELRRRIADGEAAKVQLRQLLTERVEKMQAELDAL
jgi:hypothetical protein